MGGNKVKNVGCNMVGVGMYNRIAEQAWVKCCNIIEYIIEYNII